MVVMRALFVFVDLDVANDQLPVHKHTKAVGNVRFAQADRFDLRPGQRQTSHILVEERKLERSSFVANVNVGLYAHCFLKLKSKDKAAFSIW